MFSRFSIALTASALCLSTSALGQWSDGFETYPDGPLAGNGGWEVWYTGGNDGTVTSARAHTGTKSMRIDLLTDVVQRYNIDGGQWVFTAWTYMPSDAGGVFNQDAFIILMNQYEVVNNWSQQVRFSFVEQIVENQDPPNETLPLVLDQWVEFRVEIDLDADLVNSFYNNQPLAVNRSWTDGTSGGGLPQIRALDLYSDSVDGFHFDDISLVPGGAPPCPGDLDGDGDVDLGDLATLLSNFGASGNATPQQGDTDGDLDVDLADLAALLGNFGSTC